MQCPNCRQESDDAALECPKCGLILAKWRARLQQAQAGQSVSVKAAPAAKKASGLDLTVWILLLTATAGVWKLCRYGSGTAPAAAPAVASTGAGTAPVPEDSWRFEGRVTNLLRGNPIQGVKVVFTSFENGHQYEDATDADGRFAVEVPVSWKLGYAAEVLHPLYQQRYWSGSDLTAERPQRLRLGLQPPHTEPDTRCYRGTRKKGPVTLDFALFPQDLSDAERQEAGL